MGNVDLRSDDDELLRVGRGFLLWSNFGPQLNHPHRSTLRKCRDDRHRSGAYSTFYDEEKMPTFECSSPLAYRSCKLGSSQGNWFSSTNEESNGWKSVGAKGLTKDISVIWNRRWALIGQKKSFELDLSVSRSDVSRSQRMSNDILLCLSSLRRIKDQCMITFVLVRSIREKQWKETSDFGLIRDLFIIIINLSDVILFNLFFFLWIFSSFSFHSHQQRSSNAHCYNEKKEKTMLTKEKTTKKRLSLNHNRGKWEKTCSIQMRETGRGRARERWWKTSPRTFPWFLRLFKMDT